ncbi:MAG TPA: transglycosylase SLT domain-containing protein [Pyrinomonadaceae bacterium]|nr:transglycosylase SLT domain-containing protein [Pyrinomonadaceae bacterium]
MKVTTKLVLFLGLLFLLPTSSDTLRAQTSADTYQQMTQSQRSEFVATQARRIASELSGRDYEFTPAFVEEIQAAVNRYAQRIGNDDVALDKRDLRLTIARGQTEAPKLIAAFKARNLSPLFGLYIPWIESAYVNIQTPNASGSLGMFQFLPKTGERYGLSAEELLDTDKSADAAARYLTDSLDKFKGDPMKEALALLAYNRGEQRTTADLKLFVTDKTKQCSICALTAARDKADVTFQTESVYYVPRFFAAAIIGENPQAFGIKSKPLSSY